MTDTTEKAGTGQGLTQLSASTSGDTGAGTNASTQTPAGSAAAATGADAQSTAAAQPAATTDSESLALLRKIDANVGVLTTRMENVEKVAARSGAVAGAVAGGLTGGIVGAGIAFARAKLGW
ncbi:hypothetical protein [Paraburkholderia humisilvae]|uniref:Uncharacterized protein n=1 Tax=Paraburkholderia humisilvae TaxID=627669 RepID=A0A6J5EG40_9BURK|nr:hypothetical protein [Paraburkholderia humisilvae]CAB3764162.1 hypothetical protein LMG29542_04798 [Paraburkholderia humisilvae]